MNLKSFSAIGQPKQFFAQIEEKLKGRSLGEITRFETNDATIHVRFEKMGSSEIEYSVKKTDTGFQAILVKEKIAMLHKPLKNDILSKLVKVIEACGGKTEVA